MFLFGGFWGVFSKPFWRRDSFITHRAFCDALAGERAKAQPQTVDKSDLDSGSKAAKTVVARPNPEPSPPPPPSPPATSPPQSSCELTTSVLPVPSQGKVNLLALFSLSCMVFGLCETTKRKPKSELCCLLFVFVCYCSLFPSGWKPEQWRWCDDLQEIWGSILKWTSFSFLFFWFWNGYSKPVRFRTFVKEIPQVLQKLKEDLERAFIVNKMIEDSSFSFSFKEFPDVYLSVAMWTFSVCPFFTPVFFLRRFLFFSTELLENPPQCIEEAPATTGISGIGSSSKSSSSNSSTISGGFAGLFSSSSTSISFQPPRHPPAFTDLMQAMACSDRSSEYAPSPSIEPISLCLAMNQGPPMFGTTSQDLRRFTPTPQPAISATALLQKAAQMGSAASNASLLRGLGLVSSSSVTAQQESSPWNQHRQVEPDGISIAAGLGLGLPCDGNSGLKELMRGNRSMFAPKHTTLDFLGLGMAASGSPSSGLAALITSVSSSVDVATATRDIPSKDLNRSNWNWNRNKKPQKKRRCCILKCKVATVPQNLFPFVCLLNFLGRSSYHTFGFCKLCCHLGFRNSSDMDSMSVFNLCKRSLSKIKFVNSAQEFILFFKPNHTVIWNALNWGEIQFEFWII